TRIIHFSHIQHVTTDPAAHGRLMSDHTWDVRIATGVNTKTGRPEIYYRKAGSMKWINKSILINKDLPAAALMMGGGPLMFGPKNKTVYFDTWTNNAAGTKGLYSYNPSSDKKTLLYANPNVD